MPTPSGRFHWPEKSGYLPKSTIWARAAGAREAAKAAARAVTISVRMLILNRDCAMRGHLLVRRLPQFRADAEGGADASGAAMAPDRPDIFWPPKRKSLAS